METQQLFHDLIQTGENNTEHNMYIQTRRNTHIPTRPTGNCRSLIMTFIMFGTCNFPAHTRRHTQEQGDISGS